MPNLNAGALVSCLTGKLAARETHGKHRKFEIYDDADRLAAWTQVSHSWRPNTTLDPRMVSTIAHQLRLQRASQLIETVDCTISRAQYLTMIRGTG